MGQSCSHRLDLIVRQNTLAVASALTQDASTQIEGLQYLVAAPNGLNTPAHSRGSDLSVILALAVYDPVYRQWLPTLPCLSYAAA